MKISGRNKVNPNFNMSSMTDIVFLLLIFFMITSTLVTVSAIDVYLPKAGGKTENAASVAVTITKNAFFYVDKEKVSATQLEQVLLQRVGAEKKKTVVIRGDKEVPYKNVMQVIHIANKNKLKMILAVKGK